jgi:hypothetical protein
VSKPPVLFAATSPAPTIITGNLTLYKHTWEDHIEPDHPDVDFFHVKDAMLDPCYICASATVPGSLVLVSERGTNDFGDPLRVPVKPTQGDNVVTTAYYSASQSHGTVLWKRGDG